MKELLRTTDSVWMSWLTALLSDSDIEAFVLEGHTSVLEGSAMAISRRLCVIDEAYNHAVRVLVAAGELDAPPPTDDAFLGGRIVLKQPETGFRAAVDPVFLAAATPMVAGRVLDVGTGVGTAALCYAYRVPGAQVTGLEIQADLATLARANVAANDLCDRVAIVTGDLLAPPAVVVDEPFDHVMANPPYMPLSRGGAPENSSRAISMVEGDANLAAWVEFCVSRVKPKGSVTFVHRADRLDDLIGALRTCDTGGFIVFPLWSGKGRPAKRILVQARRDVRTPLRLPSGLLLHKDDGGYTQAAMDILRGGDALRL